MSVAERASSYGFFNTRTNYRTGKKATSKGLVRLFIFCFSLSIFPAFIAEPQDKEKDKEGESSGIVLKSRDGLNFSLPSDWPVEKRGGIVGPIPVEEYLARKFEAMDARIRSSEQQIQVLDMKIRVIEEQLKKQRLQSLENPS